MASEVVRRLRVTRKRIHVLMGSRWSSDTTSLTHRPNRLQLSAITGLVAAIAGQWSGSISFMSGIVHAENV